MSAHVAENKPFLEQITIISLCVIDINSKDDILNIFDTFEFFIPTKDVYLIIIKFLYVVGDNRGFRSTGIKTKMIYLTSSLAKLLKHDKHS